jgi:hypothetical protein
LDLLNLALYLKSARDGTNGTGRVHFSKPDRVIGVTISTSGGSGVLCRVQHDTAQLKTGSGAGDRRATRVDPRPQLEHPTSKPKEGGGSGRVGHRHPRGADLPEARRDPARAPPPADRGRSGRCGGGGGGGKWGARGKRESKAAAAEISAGSMEPADGKRAGDGSAPER